MTKALNPQIQETQQIPNTRNMKKTTLRFIIIKVLKTSCKEKNLKSSLRKLTHYIQRKKDKMTVIYSSETRQVRKQWFNIFKVLKNTEILYPGEKTK